MRIWDNLDEEIQVKLTVYQLEHYGTALKVKFESHPTATVDIEPLEDIGRLMSRAPSRSRGDE